MGNALRVNALELLRRPGTERCVDTTVEVEDLGIDDPRYASHAPVHVRLRLESLTPAAGSGAIVVTGTITSRWQGICRRCAVPATGELVSQIDELYQQVPTDPDAFELGDQLDLVPMVREVLVLDAPQSPLCRDDCAGLCPACGIDRNTGSCDCADDTTDPRWAALRDWQDRPRR